MYDSLFKTLEVYANTLERLRAEVLIVEESTHKVSRLLFKLLDIVHECNIRGTRSTSLPQRRMKQITQSISNFMDMMNLTKKRATIGQFGRSGAQEQPRSNSIRMDQKTIYSRKYSDWVSREHQGSDLNEGNGDLIMLSKTHNLGLDVRAKTTKPSTINSFRNYKGGNPIWYKEGRRRYQTTRDITYAIDNPESADRRG